MLAFPASNDVLKKVWGRLVHSPEQFFWEAFLRSRLPWVTAIALTWLSNKTLKIGLFEHLISSRIILDLNTLTANYEHSRSNRENLPLPIQIQLSKKSKIFCCFFCIFGICIKFAIFWNKNEPHRSSISEVIDSERCAYLNA